VDKGKKVADAADIAVDASEMAEADPDTITAEDIVRISAAIAALVDPTGIAGTIAAYTYPKCSKIT